MDILSQIILNSFITGAIYSLIALGFNLNYWVTKFFNIAHGVFAVVGVYTVLLLYKMMGLNLYMSIPAGIGFAGITGLLSDKIIFRVLRKKEASSVVKLVASLGLFTAVQSLVAMVFDSDFKILTSTFQTQRSFSVFGGVITDIHIFIMMSVTAILIILTFVLNKTKFGKSVKAIGDDEEVAKIIGINTDRVIGYVFLIGSAIAGIGGILVGFDTGLMPTMGMGLLLKGAIASIVGGIGNIYGGVLGAFFLGFVENFGIWYIPGEWKDAIAFGLLISFLLFRPRGILKT
jgi:branched-chain amino acid transport system permease protein